MAEPGPETEGLNAQQQETLLRLARETIAQYARDRKVPELPTGDPALQASRAVFVTLHKRGMLRGCIGSLEARLPLAEAVRSSAISAAFGDPRFPPVTAGEVNDLEIEISVLSPLRRVGSADEIAVGTHGVVVSKGMRSGVFLPQVATEQGWDRETMLNCLCSHKAGLPEDAWRRGCDLSVFTTQVFAERR